MIRSIAFGSQSAASSARRAASTPRSLEVTVGAAKWRNADAGALDDPLVRRLDTVGGQARGQRLVADLVGRQEAAGSGDSSVAGGGRRHADWMASDVGTPFAAPAPGMRRERSADPVLDPVEQTVAGRIIGAVERLLERERVGRTVALEDEAAQAEQGGAVVATRVDAALEVAQHRQRRQRRQLVSRSRLNSWRSKPVSMAAAPSAVFRATLPTKPSQTTMSVVPLKMSLPSTLPWKLTQPGRGGSTQQLGGLLDHVAALDRLLADVEQADRRLFVAFDRGDQRAAHDRELQQMLGAAVDIGAEVEHRGVGVPLVRQHGRDGRPVDAVDRLENVARDRHQRARYCRPRRRPAPATAGRRAASPGSRRRASTNPSCAAARPRPSRSSRPLRPAATLLQRGQPAAGARAPRGRPGPARHRDAQRGSHRHAGRITRGAVVAAHAVDGADGSRGRRRPPSDECVIGEALAAPGVSRQPDQASALVFRTLRPR